MSWSTCYRFRCSSSAVVCLALFYIVVFNGLSLYGLIKSTYTPVSLPVNRDRLYFAYMKYDRALWKCKKPHLSQTPLPLTALASFPGSGNTWVRHILQQATGKMFNYLYTCKCQWTLNNVQMGTWRHLLQFVLIYSIGIFERQTTILRLSQNIVFTYFIYFQLALPSSYKNCNFIKKSIYEYV